jgi:hypothetical protein
MSHEADIRLLRAILAGPNDAERTANESTAFSEMLGLLESGERHVLSDKQRRWALEVHARLQPVRAGDVPRGREVPLHGPGHVLGDPRISRACRRSCESRDDLASRTENVARADRASRW